MNPSQPTSPSDPPSKAQLEQTATSQKQATFPVHSVSNSPERHSMGDCDEAYLMTNESIDFYTPFPSFPEDHAALPEMSVEDVDACFSLEPSLERNTGLPMQTLSSFQSPSLLSSSLPQASCASKRTSPSKRALALPAPTELSPLLLLPTSIPVAFETVWVLVPVAATSAQLSSSLAFSPPSQSIAFTQSPSVQPLPALPLPALQLPPVPQGLRPETYCDFVWAMDLNIDNLFVDNPETRSNEWRRLVCAIETNPSRVLRLLRTQGWKAGLLSCNENRGAYWESRCNRILTLAYIMYLKKGNSISITIRCALEMIFNIQNSVVISRCETSIYQWSGNNLGSTVLNLINSVNSSLNE